MLKLASQANPSAYLRYVKSTTLTGESGVNGVALLLAEKVGWCLRRQSEMDVGIDGQIEVFAEGEPSPPGD